ncbi:TetR/AcrR family transcriptional regulator [Nocardia sp. KC 131]|uniref:TetR/AcrR family transcriptional regulator n=1 Tax=Nocardia arseniciresistens TaxID=3392119 RepID=UPI00398F4309
MKTASSGGPTLRTDRASETRELILTAAERLFAEHGVFVVSNRQVSEAAGQGNNAAVGYHFGTKADLVRAIVEKHSVPIEQKRAQLLRSVEGSTRLRDWVSCFVRPAIDHLAELGSPTWHARFSAQVMTDPALRTIMENEALISPSLRRTIDGLAECVPDLPDDVRRTRSNMAQYLMVHMSAERERELAESVSGDAANWQDCGTDLIDAIVAIWQAPVTR